MLPGTRAFLFDFLCGQSRKRRAVCLPLGLTPPAVQNCAVLLPHRNVKFLQNVLLDSHGRAKLADFGISRVGRMAA